MATHGDSKSRDFKENIRTYVCVILHSELILCMCHFAFRINFNA